MCYSNVSQVPEFHHDVTQDKVHGYVELYFGKTPPERKEGSLDSPSLPPGGKVGGGECGGWGAKFCGILLQGKNLSVPSCKYRQLFSQTYRNQPTHWAESVEEEIGAVGIQAAVLQVQTAEGLILANELCQRWESAGSVKEDAV